jgi:hypothetical protein
MLRAKGLVLLFAGFLLSAWISVPQRVSGDGGASGRGKILLQTGVTFRTSDKMLQQVFDKAEEKAKWNIVDNFGGYQVLVEGAEYKNVWLETQPMGGVMYASRNMEIARNNILIFMDHQRDDGRFPGMIHSTEGKTSPYYDNLVGMQRSNDDRLSAYYGWFQGYCFPMPAFELYFWLGKDREYLQRLYGSLEKFDQYLWRTRDADQDGCLETWCICDTGEDGCTRFKGCQWAWPYDEAPTAEAIRNLTPDQRRAVGIHEQNPESFPTPMESMDIMSYSYTNRDVLARISKELGNGREAYWRKKANEVRKKMKSYLWIPGKHACYDRDKNSAVMDILIHNNLRCMYFGSFDQQMADDFVKYHLMNPEEFWTEMPLPSIAANDPFFRNISGNNWSGQPEGLTFQRSIRALENYGHFAELTLIGRKLLKTVGDSLKFTQQFDPFTGVITPNLDGYGPTILASLEFISRMHGIHMTREMILWSCLDDPDQYEYTQQWGDHRFEMTSQGNRVHCAINGKQIFSFTKGIRVVTDLTGKILEVAGIDTAPKNAELSLNGKTVSLKISPNSVYRYNGKFRKTREIDFYQPQIIH